MSGKGGEEGEGELFLDYTSPCELKSHHRQICVPYMCTLQCASYDQKSEKENAYLKREKASSLGGGGGIFSRNERLKEVCVVNSHFLRTRRIKIGWDLKCRRGGVV